MTPAPMRGVLMVLLAAVCWGTTGTAQSFAPISLSAFWLGALRLATAAVFFAAVLLLGRKTRGAWQLPWAAVALAGTSMAVYNLAFFAGVRATGWRWAPQWRWAAGRSGPACCRPCSASARRCAGGPAPGWRWQVASSWWRRARRQAVARCR